MSGIGDLLFGAVGVRAALLDRGQPWNIMATLPVVHVRLTEEVSAIAARRWRGPPRLPEPRHAEDAPGATPSPVASSTAVAHRPGWRISRTSSGHAATDVQLGMARMAADHHFRASDSAK